MSEIGHAALIIALPVAVFTAVASILCIRNNSSKLLTGARAGAVAVFGLYTLALVFLLYAFITRDFSIKIVAEHANQDLSSVYTLCALYADKAGSMFLWGWLVSLFTAFLAFRNSGRYRLIMPHTLYILVVLELLFIFLVTFGVNVFGRYASPPADGFGLNPLLQNFGMLVHPPLLYLGFAGFAVVFAFTMASLFNRRLDREWVVGVRKWTIFSWCMLGAGNLVGMWWSYNELGWGGYWAWDAVENAGLMPWLLATAFLHSISMKKSRNYLQFWSLILVIFTFALTLFSPFITHGGIESPLHGFYGSPFPPYILAAILVILAGSLTLFFIRRRDLEREEKPASLISREGAFLLTNILLSLLALIILAGTVLPGVIGAVGETQVVLDRSFFDRTCGPIMLAIVLLMGVCPVLGWGKTAWHSIRRNLLYSLIAAVVIVIIIFISSIGNWYAVAAIVCGLPLLTISFEVFRGMMARHRSRDENYIRAFFSFLNGNRARYGGFITHIGVILIALGIVASSLYDVEKTETLDIGESIEVGDYSLTYTELVLKQDNVKVSAVASMSVDRKGHPTGMLSPSYDYWFSYADHFAEAAVRTTPADDLFVSLVWTSYDPAEESGTFRVLVSPLIVWIWIGGGFFLLGGVFAFSSSEKQLAGVEG
ncbi:heme lyase CcmF/NrfE family subunit [Chloroflexota bacterium]